MVLQINSFFNFQNKYLNGGFGSASELRERINHKIESYKGFTKYQAPKELLKEDISHFTSKYNDQWCQKKIQDLNQILDDYQNKLRDCFESERVNLTALQAPRKGFAKKINAVYFEGNPRHLSAATDADFVSLNMRVRFQLKVNSNTLEITSIEEIQDVIFNPKELKYITAVRLVLSEHELDEEDLKILEGICRRLKQVQSVGIMSAENVSFFEYRLTEVFSAIFNRPQDLHKIFISFNSVKIDAESLAFLAEKVLPKAQKLKALGISLQKVIVTNSALQTLAEAIQPLAKNLQLFAVNLGETSVANKTLMSLLRGMPALKKFGLVVDKTSFDDRTLEYFITNVLPSFQSLDTFTMYLQRTHVTDKSVSKLFENLKNITDLKVALQGTDITDRSIQKLIENQSLKATLETLEIYLNNTQVTRDSITQIEMFQKDLSTANFTT